MTEEVKSSFLLGENELKIIKHLKFILFKSKMYEDAAMIRELERKVQNYFRELDIPFEDKEIPFETKPIIKLTTKSRWRILCEHENCQSEAVYQFLREETDPKIDNIFINLCKEHRGSHRLPEMSL